MVHAHNYTDIRSLGILQHCTLYVTRKYYYFWVYFHVNQIFRIAFNTICTLQCLNEHSNRLYLYGDPAPAG